MASKNPRTNAYIGIAIAAVVAVVTYGVGTIFSGAIYSGWTAISLAALGAGVASLQLLNLRKGPGSRNGADDLIVTTSTRNTPVPIVFGRARIGGNYLLLGNFFRIADNLNNTPSRRIYVEHAVIGLAEGPMRAMGNFRQDGKITHDIAVQEKQPDDHFEYTLLPGTTVETLPAEITSTSPARSYPPITNLAPWRRTAKLMVKTILPELPHLITINGDGVGPDYQIRYFVIYDTPDNLGHTPEYSFYDAYTEMFYYLRSDTDGTGMSAIHREATVSRSSTAPPDGVGTIILGWYLGRHDVLVFQNPDDDETFHVGYWEIESGSSDWETFKPSPEGYYANPILSHYLDEVHGILHSLHSDGTVRYIMRWTLVSGRIERLDTNLGDYTFLDLLYSPDFAAYIVVTDDGHLIMLDQKTGLTYADTTDVPTGAYRGVCVSGQRIGVIAGHNLVYYDPNFNTISDPLGWGDSGTLFAPGNFDNCRRAVQNSWTGHVTISALAESDAAFINFIPSVVEDIQDLSAKGTAGRYDSDGGFTPYPEFQTFPTPDPVAGWVRDWSYVKSDSFSVVRFQGEYSVAAAAWVVAVNEPSLESDRFGGGFDRKNFSVSSFEHLHWFCVGGVQYPNEPTNENDVPEGGPYRWAERAKVDLFVGNPVSISQFWSSEVLANCNAYRYCTGGKLHVGVQKPGVFPLWHFTDDNIQMGSGNTNFVTTRTNRIRVQFRRVLDEYRSDFAEWNNEYDQNVKGRVVPETISFESIGRVGQAKWLAGVIGARLAPRRLFVFKTSFLAYVMIAHDPAEVSYKAHALSKMPVIISSIKENDQGEIEIQALEHVPVLDGLRNAASIGTPIGGDPPPPDEPDGCLTVFGRTDLVPIWWSSGASYAAGPYFISYIRGAYKPTVDWNYAVAGYQIVTRDSMGTIIVLGDAPAVTIANPGYDTPADAAAANIGQGGNFTLDAPGPIGLLLPVMGIDDDQGVNPGYQLCVDGATYYQAMDCFGNLQNIWIQNTGQSLPLIFTIGGGGPGGGGGGVQPIDTGTDGTATTPSGDIDLVDGDVIENIIITGKISGNSLTAGQVAHISNCIIDGGYDGITEDGEGNLIGEQFCIQLNNNGGTVYIDHCEIRNCKAAGVFGDNFELTNSYIHHMASDGVKPGTNCLIQSNYFTKLGWNNPTAHADAIQITGGSNIQILNNTISIASNIEIGQTFKNNSGIFIQGAQSTGGPAASDITVDSNAIQTDHTGVQAYTDTGDGHTLTITNNVIDGHPGLHLEAGVVSSGNTDTAGTPI